MTTTTTDGRYTTTTGSKHSTTWRPVRDIARDIRADVKAAQSAGDLPADLDLSIRTRNGDVIDIVIRGREDDWQEHGPTDSDPWPRTRLTAAARDLVRKVEAIGSEYKQTTTDGGGLYRESTFYLFVEVEQKSQREWRERDAAERKAKRDAAKAAR